MEFRAENEGPQMNTDHPERRYAERRVNLAGVLELLDQTDQKHDEAHKRLRTDFRELDQRLDDGLKALADKQHTIHQRIAEIATAAATPVDVSKLVLTPKIVLSVVTMVLMIAGAFWATNAGLRSDVRDILTRMASDQRVSDANAKLLDVNNATISRALENNSRELKDALAAVNKRQDLLTLQYQQLSEQLTRLSAQQRER